MGALRRLLQMLGSGLRRLVSGGGEGSYLCDRCRWDYGNVCTRPERPNARTCPDFKRR